MGFLLFPRFSSFGKVMSDQCWRQCCTLSDGKRNNNNKGILRISGRRTKKRKNDRLKKTATDSRDRCFSADTTGYISMLSAIGRLSHPTRGGKLTISHSYTQPSIDLTRVFFGQHNNNNNNNSNNGLLFAWYLCLCKLRIWDDYKFVSKKDYYGGP